MRPQTYEWKGNAHSTNLQQPADHSRYIVHLKVREMNITSIKGVRNHEKVITALSIGKHAGVEVGQHCSGGFD